MGGKVCICLRAGPVMGMLCLHGVNLSRNSRGNYTVTRHKVNFNQLLYNIERVHCTVCSK